MQATTTHDPDPSATVWWCPSLPAGAHPAITELVPPRPIEPPPPPAAARTALLLMFGGLVIAPLAWVCWSLTTEQLAMIARRQRSARGRGAISVARGVSMVVTMLSIAAIAFLLVVGFARAR